MEQEEYRKWKREFLDAIDRDSDNAISEFSGLKLLQFGESAVGFNEPEEDGDSTRGPELNEQNLRWTIGALQRGAFLHAGSEFVMHEDGRVNWHTRRDDHYLHNRSRHASWGIKVRFFLIIGH